MSIKEEFKAGDKVTLKQEECSNSILLEQVGRILTVNDISRCFPDGSVCKEHPNCGGYGVEVNEAPINTAFFCCYVFKQVKRRKTKHSSSNLALPSSKEWRSIIDK